MNSAAMTILANETDSWMTSYQGLSDAGNQFGWLLDMRDDAMQQFTKTGLPGVRDEQWRYTNLRSLKNTTFRIYEPSKVIPSNFIQTEQPRIVFVDGHYRDDLSVVTDLGENVRLCRMADIFASQQPDQLDAIESVFGKSLPAEQHGFSALNTAFARDGYVLILEQGTVCDLPIEIYYYNTGHSKDTNNVSHMRNLILAKANSQSTIVERHIGEDGAVYLNNTVTEIHAFDNAHIDHYKLLSESDDAYHVGGVYIEQGRSSHVKSHNIALSGLMSRNDINCKLVGEGAHVEMNGLVLGRHKQHIDNHTEVTHAVPNCTSDEYYKTILDDQSRSVFRGRIIVAQDAQQTNADQQNNNLLLSKSAEADTKPQLEIYADDVKCSHGATVGQLDPKSLFYLRSRGIDADSARALLTFAFANEVIERVKVDAIREELTQTIAGQLLSGLEEML